MICRSPLFYKKCRFIINLIPAFFIDLSLKNSQGVLKNDAPGYAFIGCIAKLVE